MANHKTVACSCTAHRTFAIPAPGQSPPARDHQAQSYTPKRIHRALRRDNARQKSCPLSTCPGPSAQEFPRTARCTRRIAIRDSYIPVFSRQIAHTKAEFHDAGTNRASQRRGHRSHVPTRAALPEASPSPVSSLEFLRSAVPDTKNPTKIPNPLPYRSVAALRLPPNSPFLLLRSSFFCSGRLPEAGVLHRSTAHTLPATSPRIQLPKPCFGAILFSRCLPRSISRSFR